MQRDGAARGVRGYVVTSGHWGWGHWDPKRCGGGVLGGERRGVGVS